ncbi:MAG: EAL domain-containing protein [Beijerinckiaceae bacterium]
MNNDPSLFGATVNDEPLAGRIRAEQIASILTYTPYMLMANLINAMVLSLALAGTEQQTAALAWSALVAIFALYAFLRWRNSRGRPRRNYASTRGPRRVTWNAALLGCMWAIVPLVFTGSAASGQQLIVIAITVGMICGGAFALSTVPSAAVFFVAPIVTAALVACYIHHLEFGLHLSLLLLLFSAVIVRTSYSQASLFASGIIGEYEQEKQRDMIGILLGEFEENANDWLWETDALGRIVYISAKFSELAGLSLKNLKGKSLLRVMARGFEGAPEPEAAWRRITELMHQRQPFRSIELKILAEGAFRWCSLTGKPIYNESGKFTGFRGFCTDVTDKRENEAKIAYLARFDAVTGLPNRVSFGDRLDASFRVLNRKKRGFALLCIDLDGFKEINDTFGHAIGDAFLIEVGKRISECLGEKDFVARLGGDEFSVILAEPEAEQDASELARRIIEAVSLPFSYAGNTMKAGASIGIAFAPKDGVEREKLMVSGDLALYRAKADGRGVFRCYEAEMDEYARERRKIEGELRNAIENNELQLVFQPILNVETGRVENCEALLRWENPRLGRVSPADFVPIAEETGLIIGIGEWVIHEACRQAIRWPGYTKVAVNLSAVQFQSPGLLPVIMKALDDVELEASRLEIEITESVLLSNIDRVTAIIDTLDRLGVRIALDDFGTGYSSLAYIRQIDFDKIKIDASFVRDMLNDKSCAAIIRAVTGLARELGIRITAEGVETQEQLEVLKSEGCAEVQGYLISEPLAADEFADFVAKSQDELSLNKLSLDDPAREVA